MNFLMMRRDLIKGPEDIWNFIHGYNFECFDQLDQLDYRDIQSRYINVEAEMQVPPLELEEALLTFRLLSSKTVIYSSSLPF